VYSRGPTIVPRGLDKYIVGGTTTIVPYTIIRQVYSRGPTIVL
jgi:hypothetical protein